MVMSNPDRIVEIREFVEDPEEFDYPPRDVFIMLRDLLAEYDECDGALNWYETAYPTQVSP